ncbi:ubiquitin carboxyl-terminal hydrolase 15 isoform X2 [Prosopis cineraria]|uniref:ubiquitin carboxyl-terminal hydrolase 15 isoform X2 n=1 Tax=Prosopis cineraria TaxID=364024 RepID=UPI00240FB77E|nr:ubiquitin carboxyl-terminal hydrolase 15 isoform X2 [Prosopis cineraria]
MLEPRESDIPALFVVLVVLPLVAYFLLGKWSEAAKKRDRISLLAQLAAEEASRVEEMAISDVIPPISSTKIGHHACASCSAPAKTRCSRCKTVRYCSGNCQIIHWRQVHKHECQILETHKLNSSPLAVSVDEFSHESGLCYENMNSQFFAHNLVNALNENSPSDNLVHPPIGIVSSAMGKCALFNNSHVSTHERRTPHKSNRELRRKNSETTYDSSTNSSGCNATSHPSSIVASKEVFMRQKLENNDCAVKEDENSKVNASEVYVKEQNPSRSMMLEDDNYQNQIGHAFNTRNDQGYSSSSNVEVIGELLDQFQIDDATSGGQVVKGVNRPDDEVEQAKCSSEMTVKGSIKAKKSTHPPKTKCSKSTLKASVDLFCSEMEMEGQTADEPISGIRDPIPSLGNNGAAIMGIRKMMGMRKSAKHTVTAMKMLFPYDEFVQFFQSEVFGIYPRGLVNCGNSCYANAVLQCLTCTKPLVVYFLCRSHSKACCTKDWCLMCELEQQIMILRENGGPLSPSRILWHMRSMNSQMGDGSQEDAHEFLRLLIASMQSICLEGLGGEKKVDPRLQETTFIQHTFGGRLQSKVKCLNCNHESERYENIMDLTLEILGWVESLEDALTQFTSPEDLDGENMYKCGRCTAYVRARKKLSIHEAPNILTIVLKRFQEGRYGKINKCITFPEMLDMIPFMTGKGDIPPLYMLYAVVVHLDTLNASFSGHYVSYVKDLQGNWFRIDDTEVQPVLISQVMLEGAYILFYMRSSPRTQSPFSGKVVQQQVPSSSKQFPGESHKASKSGHRRDSRQFIVPEPSLNARAETRTHYIDASNGTLHSTNRNYLPVTETCTENIGREFSDATSSDWSLFTSSDEASFTTESTRDSFSTVDYGDSCNIDQFSSIFSYTTENSRNSVCHRKFLHSRPLTRFVPQSGQALDTNLSNNPTSDTDSLSHPLEWERRMNQSKRASHSSIEPPSSGNCGRYVYYGSTNPIARTYSHYEP